MTDPPIEFLLARILDNEAPNLAWFAPEPEDPAEWTEWFDARAESWHTRRCGSRLSEGIIKDCECGLPASVLAECKAQRSCIELADRDDDWRFGTHAEGIRAVLRQFVLAHADHPDFREEWLL